MRRGCQASQPKGLTSGEVFGTSGEVRGTSGEVRGLSRSSGEPDSLPATRRICLPSAISNRENFKRVGLFYLRLVLFAYSWSLLLTVNPVWSFLLAVELRFGLFCLQWRIGLIFFTYGSPCPEIGFGLFCLRFPPVWTLGLVFSAYGSPTISKKDEP